MDQTSKDWLNINRSYLRPLSLLVLIKSYSVPFICMHTFDAYQNFDVDELVINFRYEFINEHQQKQ